MYHHYVFAIIGTCIEAFSDISLKMYTKYNKIHYLIAGLIGYTLTGLAFTQLLKYHNLASSNIIWHTFHFIILACFSIFYLNEKYTNQSLLGIFFGIISFLLLSQTHQHTTHL